MDGGMKLDLDSCPRSLGFTNYFDLLEPVSSSITKG